MLWTFRGEIDAKLLEKRLREAGLMTEWRAFAAFAVEYLGRPKQRRDFSGMSYWWRKFFSFWGRLSDMLRHFVLFPKDSVMFFGGVLRSGLFAAVRGE